MNKPSLIAFIAGSCMLMGCGDSKDTRDSARPESALPKVTVRVETLASQNAPVFREIVGTVRARWRATLEAKIPGRIESVPVELGQTVQAGQPLARLEAREIEAQVAQAESRAELARQEFVRISKLFEGQAVTRQEFDAAQSADRTAEAALEQARALIAHREIIAPFAGVITAKLAEVGDLALPGKPLVEIEDPDKLRLEAHVPESIMAFIDRGQSMVIDLPSIQERVNGTVSEIAPQADPITRTVLVKLDLPHPPGLRTGLFGRLAVPTESDSSLFVPSSAVVVRGQMEMVFVAHENHARMRLVKTGRSWGGDLELLSGVTAGESVVVDGAASLRDGQPLEIRP